MNRKAISKRLLAIHGAVSLVFLLLISWSIWTGILSLYADLARPWLRPDVAAAYDQPTASPSEVLRFVHARNDGGPRWNMVAPTPMRPFYVYAGPGAAGGKPVVLMVNPTTGLRDEWNNFALDGLFRRIHTDLLLPKPWGRLAMGLTGTFITILVGAGLFIHGKQFKEAWKWRRRSRILNLSESHKRIGLWLTPFLLVMALTGAILGMKIATVPIAMALAGESRPAVPPRGIPEAPSPAAVGRLDACVTRAADLLPRTRFAGVERNGDRLDIRFLRLNSLQWSGEGGGSVEARCDLADGRLTVVQRQPAGGAWGVIESALRPIHYARFGGVGVLTVYIVLSLLCLWVIDSGMKLLWLRDGNRVVSEESISERLYHANNVLYVVLPLILLTGNLFFRTTPWLLMGITAAAVAIISLSGRRFVLSSRLARVVTAGCYVLLLVGRHVVGAATASSPPTVITEVSLILMATWLLLLTRRQRAPHPVANLTGAGI
ncbi:PepSY-associated TM helix domain-containing protein [Sphingomonas sp. dw_22]|uniref:PepSY-associated TM helix domain-containing protein n=1 Tax=Sphingomonas sp. dw_22 TaxID=2721175 RepID=UPI001BD6C9CD